MKTIALDEEGYFLSNHARLTDIQFAQETFDNLHINDAGVSVSKYKGESFYVEAFDQPFVISSIDKPTSGDTWSGHLPYDYKISFELSSLALDQWDRFHGTDVKGRPFVFSRSAQASFFDLLDEFDDNSITFNKQIFEVPFWLKSEATVEKGDFWSDIYSEQEQPGWDLDAPVKALVDTLPQLKLTKQRVLVLGCGKGHDAAHFAKLGHIVTAVDFSDVALNKAKEKYKDLSINWVKADFFNLPKNFKNNFDLIFEHTCFCAVDPEQRDQLVQIWRNCLVEGGHLLGVFFVHLKRFRPPFGATEWELKKRLSNKFDFRYWTRWKESHSWRKGIELVIYAQKK